MYPIIFYKLKSISKFYKYSLWVEFSQKVFFFSSLKETTKTIKKSHSVLGKDKAGMLSWGTGPTKQYFSKNLICEVFKETEIQKVWLTHWLFCDNLPLTGKILKKEMIISFLENSVGKLTHWLISWYTRKYLYKNVRQTEISSYFFF